MDNPRKKNRVSSRKLNGKPSMTHQPHPRALSREIKSQEGDDERLLKKPVRKLATTKHISKDDYSSKVDLNNWTVYEIDYSDLNGADES